MEDKYVVTFRDRTFYIDKKIAEEYTNKVRPLDRIEVLRYLFGVFDLDVSSDNIEEEFTDALKEELDVAAHLPKAIEKALKNGLFD